MRSFTGRRDGLRLGEGRLGSTPGPCFSAGIDLLWANLPGGNAVAAWDFLKNQARWNGSGIGPVSNTPNWTFTRASTGYAQTSAGALTAFASGELRRTDKGVLIEGARTNLCLQSQTFDNASWTKTSCSIVADAAVAPDGTLTADKIVEDSSNNYHSASQLPTLVSGSVYTTSVFAKAAERSWLQMTEGNNVTAQAYFNLASGVLGVVNGTGTPSATITPLGNGWYRCTLTYTPIANAGNIQARPATGDNGGTYQGDGVSGIYVWGAQLEATAYASSYIPTTTASATRAADSLTVTGVTGLDYPLSLFAEFERAVDTGGFENLFSVRNSTTDYALMYIGSSDVTSGTMVRSSANQGTPSVAGAIAIATVTRTAARFATDDMRVCRGGTLGAADTTCTLPALAPSAIEFGFNGANPSYGYLRRAAIYSRALTDAELQAVTT